MREIAFEFINQTNEQLDEYEALFNEIIEATFKMLAVEDACELSCIIVDNKEIHRINREYRQIDRPTDVISFAYEDAECFELEGMPRQLGDIFISLDKAKEQAESYGHSFKREFCFLFTHGLLHLLGYDHIEKDDEEKMLRIQKSILEALGIGR